MSSRVFLGTAAPDVGGPLGPTHSRAGFAEVGSVYAFLVLSGRVDHTSKGVRTLEGNVDTGVLSANLSSVAGALHP